MKGEKLMIHIQENSRVLFIGDSITDIRFNKRMRLQLRGNDVYALQASREMKKYAKHAKFFYKGIASNRTYHVYDRLTEDCIALKPDIVILLIGVNDAWEHYVPAEYPPLRRPMEPHMREFYRRLQAELDDVQILVLLPFLIDAMPEKAPFHHVLDDFRTRLRHMAEENGAQIIDLQACFNRAQETVPPAKLAKDGVHPTNLGHQVIAREILQCVTYR